ESGMPVEEIFKSVGVQLLCPHEIEQHARVKIARASAHRHSAGRRQSHRCVDRSAIAYRNHAAPASQVRKDRTSWELRSQAMHKRFIREPVKAVSPDSIHEVSLRQRQVCRRLGHRAMKRGIEAGDMERVGKLLLRLSYQLQSLWNVQGRKVHSGF